MPAENPIVVALDMPRAEALALASVLQGRVRWVKVGMTLYYAEGPSIVSALQSLGFDVFLDLKLHDIPHQVAGAAAAIARLGVGMFTVHATGGPAMMTAAVESSRRVAEESGVTAPVVLAVTVLTSTNDEGLRMTGVDAIAADQVARLAALARDAGVGGLVCSPAEASRVRVIVGDEALIVTPGVRPVGASTDDQARFATPRTALEAGATHLVIGRPITAAADPMGTLEGILTEIEGV